MGVNQEVLAQLFSGLDAVAVNYGAQACAGG